MAFRVSGPPGALVLKLRMAERPFVLFLVRVAEWEPSRSVPLSDAKSVAAKSVLEGNEKRWTIKREPSSFGRKSADPDGSGVRVAWETKSRKPRRKAKLRV